MTLFAAQPGTYIVDTKGNRVPIIAFEFITGGLAHPRTAIPRKTAIARDEAILHPTGDISYPHGGSTFESFRDWESHMNGEEAENAFGEPPEGAPDNSKIVFGDRKYAQKSFWRWEATTSIFALEPDVPAPNDARIEKITRKEFYDAKRLNWHVIDPHNGQILEGDVDEPAGTVGGAQMTGDDEPEPHKPAVEDDDSDVI